MIVYFAEPIDQDASPSLDERSLREGLVNTIRQWGGTVYRPATAWGLQHHPDSEFQRLAETLELINRAALDKADLLVARLPKGVATHGVPMEIEYATRVLNIPAIVVGDVGVSLTANPHVTVVAPYDFDRLGTLTQQVTTGELRNTRALFHTGSLNPRSYSTDAGIDLVTTEDTTVEAGAHGFIPTGSKIQVPPGTFLWITARSSTYRNFGLTVLPGIIDEGYTGELLASVVNHGDTPVTVKRGDRVCQVIVMPNETAKYETVRVESIVGGDRGENGFGSTGKDHGLRAVTG